MEAVNKIVRAYRRGGVQDVARSTYLRLRPGLSFVPTSPVMKGGVKVGTRLGTDRLFSINEDIPLYEHALLAGLRTHVRPGDRVVVIGCGEGVTATIAAKLAGPLGSVVAYEGSRGQVEVSHRTFADNKVSNVKIHHAIVASAVGVYGESTEFGGNVAPDALPDCDVLEMDCEGSEIEILQKLTIRPRAILVETHGVFGAPTAAVADLLDSLGYAVTDLGWAETYLLKACEDNDIRVLEGVSRYTGL